MELKPLYSALADAFSGDLAIERNARQALLSADVGDHSANEGAPLPQPYLDVMAQSDAHPVCQLIAETPFQWTPPQTSDEPLYVQHSHFKAHVELIGPDGIVKSDAIRLGLYGFLPGNEYGIRTHPAEEIFVMLAGKAYWKRGDRPYLLHGAGERSHHPSMMPHATRSGDSAFMSVHVWHGDISTDGYSYAGVPKN